MAMPSLHIRLKPTTDRRLKDVAAAQDTSQGELARRAIDAYLDGTDLLAMLDAKSRMLDERIKAVDAQIAAVLDARVEEHIQALASSFARVHMTVDQTGKTVGLGLEAA